MPRLVRSDVRKLLQTEVALNRHLKAMAQSNEAGDDPIILLAYRISVKRIEALKKTCDEVADDPEVFDDLAL